MPNKSNNPFKKGDLAVTTRPVLLKGKAFLHVGKIIEVSDIDRACIIFNFDSKQITARCDLFRPATPMDLINEQL